MTGPEYQSLRQALGLTQQQLADVLQVNRVTVAKRESGAVPILKEAELALQGLHASRRWWRRSVKRRKAS